MLFDEIVSRRRTYSLHHLHPIFMWKTILAIKYWLTSKMIKYQYLQEGDSAVVQVVDGVRITTEDEGEYIYFDYKHAYPSKIDAYLNSYPVMLCDYEDELDEMYFSRFAPGLYSLVQDYNLLHEFNKYIACDERTLNFLRKWIDIEQVDEGLVDVLFIVQGYDVRDLVRKVLLGKELVIMYYGVGQSEVIHTKKVGMKLTIKDNLVLEEISRV